MSNKHALQRIKAFGMTNQMVTEDIQRIGAQFGIELGQVEGPREVGVDSYYPQFDAAVRAEAASMSRHYEAFYCLEISIRGLVAETIELAEAKKDWWNSARIPTGIASEVAGRIQRELDSGMTRRSDNELDYTTFGELANIISANWDIFGGMFSSKKAVERVMANLNSLRGPIAHCSPLADDEVQRLQLTVRDWFRLME